MKPALEGYADRVVATASPEDLRRLAEESGAVDRLVATNGHLRAVLTDTAVSPAARRSIIDDLLAERVSPITRRLVRFACGAVSAPEVPAALSWVAAEAARGAAGEVGVRTTLGRAGSRARVGGYAAALEEDLGVEDLEEIEDALFRLARVVESAPPLRKALSDRDLPAPKRAAILADLLAGKVPQSTSDLVGYVATAGRPRDVVGTLDWLAERTAAARGWRMARVHAGQAVGPAQRQELSESLARLAGAPVDLEITEEKELLGGVVVEIGDLLLDASARGRLERLKEHLLGGDWGEAGAMATQRSLSQKGADR